MDIDLTELVDPERIQKSSSFGPIEELLFSLYRDLYFRTSLQARALSLGFDGFPIDR